LVLEVLLNFVGLRSPLYTSFFVDVTLYP
jgi:hypothetical protein